MRWSVVGIYMGFTSLSVTRNYDQLSWVNDIWNKSHMNSGLQRGPEYFSGFFTQLHKLRSLQRSFLHFHFISTVHIWFISYIINTHFFHRNIWTHNWPASNVSGFIAQLVEHHTSNREVTGSNPVEVLNFFLASLHNCINCVHCDDDFFIFILF